jgi:hypothetical protein
MLRGITNCDVEGFTTGFVPVFSGFALTGVALIITLKVILMVQQIVKQSKGVALLPISHHDIAIGATTAIQRSPSDPTLYKRYMTAREPPLSPGGLVTPRSGLKSPFESFRPSSPSTVASSEREEVQLELPKAIQETE